MYQCNISHYLSTLLLERLLVSRALDICSSCRIYDLLSGFLDTTSMPAPALTTASLWLVNASVFRAPNASSPSPQSNSARQPHLRRLRLRYYGAAMPAALALNIDNTPIAITILIIIDDEYARSKMIYSHYLWVVITIFDSWLFDIVVYSHCFLIPLCVSWYWPKQLLAGTMIYGWSINTDFATGLRLSAPVIFLSCRHWRRYASPQQIEPYWHISFDTHDISVFFARILTVILILFSIIYLAYWYYMLLLAPAWTFC